MAISNANFINLSAAGVADFLGNGAIEVPEFQREITDIVRRNGVLGQRIQYVPATGSISRFFTEDSIGTGTFTDPRNMNPASTGPVRTEHSVLIKAITNRVDYNHFDLETTAQQAIFSQLKAKDLQDCVNGIIVARDQAIWSGTDIVSGSQVGNNTTSQFVGLFSQITQTLTITSGTSIIDTLRTQVATMAANVGYNVKVSAIYCNPMVIDYIEQEAKNSANSAVKYVQVNDATSALAGLTISHLATVVGLIPLIADPFMAKNATVGSIPAAPNGQANYPFAIVTENLLEMHYVGSKVPRLFRLGTLASLAESYVGVLYQAPVAKLPGVAHCVGVVQR